MRPEALFHLFKENGIDCYCGVPDSLLKDFCAYITDHTDSNTHTITANEGNAIALAAGHYLATGQVACVYMQNSGIGNAVNPLLSLTDKAVYNIPLLMLIGWRGEPEKPDEPQHITQGKVTLTLLESMGIQYAVLPKSFEKAKVIVNDAIRYIKKTKEPFAFVIQKGLFEPYTLTSKKDSIYELKREEAIKFILKELSITDIVVSTTGHISREVYEIREKWGKRHQQDFLTVGSMGHASSIALGIALAKPDRKVYCLDGDGAFLMHQGALVVNASKNLKNFKHIVFNNEVHDSVGAQPTAIEKANISQLALNAGYTKAYSVTTKAELEQFLPLFLTEDETVLLEVKVKSGARADLGRPKESPKDNKRIFMENLKQVAFVYPGAIENLSNVIYSNGIKKALVFTGKASFEKIRPLIENQLKGCEVKYYSNFSANPKKEEIDQCIEKLRETENDILIAIGGGSVIDFAKAYRYETNQTVPLVAIPTTAGSGAEATPFAVLYIQGEKHSLDDPEILPDYAIVDSRFVTDSPSYLKATTAMDAYCQAIESYWSVLATPESKVNAKEAILLCRDYIVQYVNTHDEIAAEKMMLASHLAGKAIHVSRTTASHALSYAITTKYGLAHGHAVALTIARLMRLNTEITEDSINPIVEMAEIHQVIKDLKEWISNEPEKYFKELFSQIGLENDLTKWTIKDKEFLADQVNLERLNNNPRKLNYQDLMFLLGAHE